MGEVLWGFISLRILKKNRDHHGVLLQIETRPHTYLHTRHGNTVYLLSSQKLRRRSGGRREDKNELTT